MSKFSLTPFLVCSMRADNDSPLTKLRSRTLYGRPDFSQIFGSLAKSIEDGSYLPGREARLKNRVGVYYCGVSLSAGPLMWGGD